MKDVARIAGVSTSTVSHVINKDRFVSEAITAKVDAAIKSLNYAPSALARSLKLNQTRTIGMLITASTNPFYSELVRGVERSCFERGYSLVLCNTEGDEQRMNRNLETLMQKRVDGLLLLCTETLLWSSFFGHADQMVGLCTGGQLGGRAGQRFVLCG